MHTTHIIIILAAHAACLSACGAEVTIACYQAGNVRMACEPHAYGWPWLLGDAVTAIENETGREIPPTWVVAYERQPGDDYGSTEIHACGDTEITLYAEGQYTIDTRSLLHELAHAAYDDAGLGHPDHIFGAGAELDRATCALIPHWPGC